MTVIEFSRFLSLYKRVNQIVEKIYNSKHGNEENNNFPVFGSKNANSLKVVW